MRRIAIGRGPPQEGKSCGGGHRVGQAAGERRPPHAGQDSPIRGRETRAGLTDGQIVKEGVRDLKDQLR